MGLTSEQVHWIYGGTIAAAAVVLLASEMMARQRAWARWIVPVLLIVAGLALVFDPLLHGPAAPAGYEHETRQHLLRGLGLFAVGVIEAMMAGGRLTARAARLALPVALAAAGLLFVFHAQHVTAGPAILLITQHRILGVTLLLVAATKAAGDLGGTFSRTLGAAWLVLLLVVGAELLLYREGHTGVGPVAVDEGAAGQRHQGH